MVCVHIDALGVERRPDGVAEHEDELVGVVVGARGQHTVLGARLDVEAMECRTVSLALGEDCSPRQPRLGALERQLLKEWNIAPLLHAPLFSHVPLVLFAHGAAVHLLEP